MGQVATETAVVVLDQKLIIIPNPEAGEYQLHVNSIGDSGYYSLFSGTSNSLGLNLQRIDAQLTVGDTDTYIQSPDSGLSILEPTNELDFVELVGELINHLNPVLEPLGYNQMRLTNLKNYLSTQFENYSTASIDSRRTILFTSLDQLMRVDRNSDFDNTNKIVINDLQDLIRSRLDANTSSEIIKQNYYDFLSQKVASKEAQFESMYLVSNVSTASALNFENIISIKTPPATQSSNLNQDMLKLFLKSVMFPQL